MEKVFRLIVSSLIADAENDNACVMGNANKVFT